MLQDFVVPKSKDPPAKAREVIRSLGIALRTVLTAIGFDNKLAIDAGEVGDAVADRHLLSELEVAELAVAKVKPESPLGIGRFAAKPARMGVSPSDRCHRQGLEEETPSPNPLP